MDAFFASVEQQANPRLRGKPIAVIGSGARTVITTRSYEARKYGVKTGMNIYEAKKLCPQLILVKGDNTKYTHTCRELTKLYSRYTPDMETYSIDEAFLDITTTHHLFGGPEEIGRAIKAEVQEIFGITCTIGIAPNILMAKLASDLAKPDGIRWIKEEQISSVLEDLPVDQLWGIGSATRERLAGMGIRTCGELGRTPVSLLRNRFGIMGEHLKAMGMGICNRPVASTEAEPKSIGHSCTLPRDIVKREEIERHLLRLSEMVGKRARKAGLSGKRVSLTIRYPDFETFTRQTGLQDYTNHSHEIYRASLSILNTIGLKKSIRLIGVCLSDLVAGYSQMSLFKERARETALLTAVDTINDRFGEFGITWASYLEQEKGQRVISP
ncbi:MAG: DNA polymerase IV, partial [Nitrospirales bacterium]|nr:DNA polymerase IV [Nitrospirales bacterium]